MKRRDFLASSVAASGMVLQGATGHAASRPGGFYELRVYHLRQPARDGLLDKFYESAVPALRAAGLGPVGAFYPLKPDDPPALYALLAYPSAQLAADVSPRLEVDPNFAGQAGAFISATPQEPAYLRMESSLLRAFSGMPRIEVPLAAAQRAPRIFELRTYESHSKKANRTKIEMFNRGEIGIFRRTGLRPVFLGETLVGAGQPNLTYMLTFADMDERERNWKTFAADPEWKKLSATPGYTDGEIVSHITNLFLTPAPYSQI